MNSLQLSRNVILGFGLFGLWWTLQGSVVDVGGFVSACNHSIVGDVVDVGDVYTVYAGEESRSDSNTVGSGQTSPNVPHVLHKSTIARTYMWGTLLKIGAIVPQRPTQVSDYAHLRKCVISHTLGALFPPRPAANRKGARNLPFPPKTEPAMTRRPDPAVIAADIAMADEANARRSRDGLTFNSLKVCLGWFFEMRARLQCPPSMRLNTSPTGRGQEEVLVSVDGGRGGDLAETHTTLLTVQTALVDLYGESQLWWKMIHEAYEQGLNQRDIARNHHMSQASVSREIGKAEKFLLDELRGEVLR